MNTTKEQEIFCQNIRYLRKKYHLSLVSMAMLLEISQNSMHLLDKNILTDRVTAASLYRLHEIFRIPVDTLLHTSLEDAK